MPRISEIDPAHAPEAIQKIIADHVADGHALTAEKRTLLHNDGRSWPVCFITFTTRSNETEWVPSENEA